MLAHLCGEEGGGRGREVRREGGGGERGREVRRERGRWGRWREGGRERGERGKEGRLGEQGRYIKGRKSRWKSSGMTEEGTEWGHNMEWNDVRHKGGVRGHCSPACSSTARLLTVTTPPFSTDSCSVSAKR